MTSADLAFKINALTQSVDSLVIVAATLDAEVPLYAVGGVGLAVASIGEHIVNRGLEVHAVASRLRPVAHDDAELIAPELLRYFHHLISTGREPGREVGRWS